VSLLDPIRAQPRRAAAAILGVLCLVTVVGLVVLWPGDRPADEDLVTVTSTVPAEVTAIRGEEACATFAGPGCRLAEIELLEGPQAGRTSAITLSGGEAVAPPVQAGDRIRVARNVPAGLDEGLADRLPIEDPSQMPYSFIDFERRSPLLFLGIAFAALVVVFGRAKGARSLIGLGLSLVVVVEWLVPSILDGNPPLAVALVGALAVMLLTIGIAHGPGVKSAAAMLGTTGALLLTASLALAFVELAHITGLASEQSTLLFSASGGDLSLEALVLAGIVVGALGVLDDVTVSQASTVLALRRANPAMRLRALIKEAMDVGRDHLSATVNTLVLAYAGAALPVLLLFADQRTSFGEAVNREPVAAEIVAMLVGSIGLIAAVPLTTALAAVLATGMDPEALPDDAHAGHAH
jgi:uncharacterized membrane protein